MGKGIFVSRDMRFFRVNYEKLEFSGVNCDMLYSREAWFVIKMSREIRIVRFVNCGLVSIMAIYFNDYIYVHIKICNI